MSHTPATALNLSLPAPRDTEAFGEALGRRLEVHDLVALTGPLGAGKTTLVRGSVRGRGSSAHVRSASFAWVQEYRGRLPITHLDLYRLRDVSELGGIGWEEYLDRPGVVLVEWGERAGEALPAARWEVEISAEGDGRRVGVRAFGGGPAAGLAALSGELA